MCQRGAGLLGIWLDGIQTHHLVLHHLVLLLKLDYIFKHTPNVPHEYFNPKKKYLVFNKTIHTV